MSQFTPTVEFTTEFDGDTITMTLRRLSRAQLHIAAPVMDPGVLGTFEGKLKYLDIMAELLPQVVTNFKGLHIAGVEAKLDDILLEGFFSPLLDDIGDKLFQVSFYQVEDIKKSNRSADESSKE